METKGSLRKDLNRLDRKVRLLDDLVEDTLLRNTSVSLQKYEELEQHCKKLEHILCQLTEQLGYNIEYCPEGWYLKEQSDE